MRGRILIAAAIAALPLSAQAGMGHFNMGNMGRVNCPPGTAGVQGGTTINSNINQSTNINVNRPLNVYSPVTVNSNIDGPPTSPRT